MNETINPTREDELRQDPLPESAVDPSEFSDPTESAENTEDGQIPENEKRTKYVLQDEDGDGDVDDDDIFAVAQRIMGERHTRAATAAPIRTRPTNLGDSRPAPTSGVPVRMSHTGLIPLVPNVRQHDLTAAKRRKRFFTGTIVAAVLILLLLTSAVLTANYIAGRSASDDPDQQVEAETPEKLAAPDEPEETPDTDTAPGSAETDAPVEEGPQTDLPKEPSGTDASSETEPETPVEETEPETEPAAPTYQVFLDFYDRDDLWTTTEQTTLRELLAQLGVELTGEYIPSLSLDSVIAADTTVQIDKLSWTTETVSESLPYESEVIETDWIPRGTTEYLQYGEAGEIQRTYTVEYRNGVEQNRTLSYEETTKWPVAERYELGVGGTVYGSDGTAHSYSYRRVVPATYYNIEGLTYLGTMADESVIAVDMDYIPLGTQLYVKNDRYDFGVRTASDIGGGVDEWEIDIWIGENNPYLPAFRQEGYVYDMEIYYLD